VFTQTDVSESWLSVPRFNANSNLKQISFLLFPTVVVPPFLPSRQDLSRFFLRPSNSRDGRGNPAVGAGKPHAAAPMGREHFDWGTIDVTLNLFEQYSAHLICYMCVSLRYTNNLDKNLFVCIFRNPVEIKKRRPNLASKVGSDSHDFSSSAYIGI